MKKSLLAILVLAAVADTQAAGIDVNSLADTAADDGSCTLREAVTAANTDSASGAMTGECAAGSGADTIEFPAPLVGTITLGTTLPTVTTPLEINGPTDRSITISGTGIQLLDLNDGTTARLLTAVRRLTFSGGTLAIQTSEFLHVDACLLTGAQAALEVETDGSLLLTNSTVSGNTSPVFAILGNLLNSIISNSTVTANNAGIAGTFSLINSVISGNSQDCSGVGVVATGDVASFIGDSSCLPIPASGNAMLLGLADNGGPTMTHGLAIGSPLRDAGNDGACLSTDQRGGDRAADGDGIGGARCDIGAVEVADAMSTAVFLESFEIE